MSKRGSGSSARNNRNFSDAVAIEVTTKDGTMDVRDALLEKRSRVEISKIVSDYGLK